MKLKMHSIFCIPIEIEFAFEGGKVGDNINILFGIIYINLKKINKFCDRKERKPKGKHCGFWGKFINSNAENHKPLSCTFLGIYFFSPRYSVN